MFTSHWQADSCNNFRAHISFWSLTIIIIVPLKSTFHCLISFFFFFYSNILTLRQTIRMIGCILVPLYMKKKRLEQYKLNMYKHIRKVLQTLCVPLMQLHSLYKMYMYSNLYISFTLHKTVILLFSSLVRSGILNNKFIYNNKPYRLESLVHWRHEHFLPLKASLSQLPPEKCIGYSENKTHST